ncbi:MAG: 2-C-methyl-D-erythritol 4-phosphate cytidylyltransferase [Lachnospiraceae bacterium]|nr:2-C-methyl-D-erythritol 4-phosphate cytidylyltransferase [Lachnospiraceae bacterium]
MITRNNQRAPKQFIKIKGKPIIAYTLDILEQNENIDAVEVVCVHGFEDLLKNIIEEQKEVKNTDLYKN